MCAQPHPLFPGVGAPLPTARARAAAHFLARLDFDGEVARYRTPVEGVKTFLVIPKRSGNIEILDFEVHTPGEGIGTRAITEFAQAAIAAGYRRLRADSTADALPFWRSVGFEDSGRKDGRLHITFADFDKPAIAYARSANEQPAPVVRQQRKFA